jgi:hypothetical protein
MDMNTQATVDHVGDNYRHVLIQNTHNPLSFYQMSVEYSDGKYQSEINRSSHVTIYGYKYESTQDAKAPGSKEMLPIPNRILQIVDSQDIAVIGGSGNYSVYKDGEGIIGIERSSGIYLANLHRTGKDDNKGIVKNWIVGDAGTIGTGDNILLFVIPPEVGQ